MSGFAHLHVHTEYSLLDGVGKIPKLLEEAKHHGQKALAITDHGNMHGAVHFYNYAKEKGVKPIIGLEAYVASKSRFEKQIKPGSDQFHLLLLAKNYDGYKNLLKLASISHLEGFSYKPRIDFELLKQFKDGLIVTTGCLSSQFSQLILHNRRDEAIELMKQYEKVFGDDFYLEVQAHPQVKEVEEMRKEMIKISREYGWPLLATNDVHYIKKEDAEAQDALLAVQMRKVVSDPNRFSMLNSPDYYLRTTEEMEQLFKECPDAIENAAKVADLCNVEIPIGKWILPIYPIPDGETNESWFKHMAREGLKRRIPHADEKARERLEYELDIISDKGFATYFLIVQDFVNWAKNQGIYVGPGRGSAAGSLAAFSLGITNMNPLQHGLPFERFMNPQRPTPPDIDMDFADLRREEVIQYVTQRYGVDKVAQIVTFGAMEARAAIRDMGRALGMPFSEPDKVAKLIPTGMGLQESLDSVQELKEFYKQPNYKKLIDLAMKVEGNVRHTSVHAAGLVISDKPLMEYTPIMREAGAEGKIVTQYDMKALDRNVSDTAIGLLKMDFLGLRNLSILGEAITVIKKTQNKDIDLVNIPIDDPAVFKLLSSGETTGVFQLESGGMRRVARALRPSTFSDITAMVALYRPGPMDLINDFVARKHNPKLVVYPHISLEPVLKETYGIMVYQEQALQVANVLAGYSLGEADILRRAIGKKKIEIMNEQHAEFVKRSVAQGHTKEVAEQVWSYIEKFAGYGFNKAHAASYAMIAYQTAYMKVHYPVEYMTALLSIEANATGANREEKLSQGINECRRMNIVILPPDINRSDKYFTIEQNEKSLEKKAIRYGFSAIKNVGSAAIEAIEQARGKKPFASFSEFLVRVDSRRANKKVLECLIKVGAMDAFSNRASMLEQLEDIRSKLAGVSTSDGNQDNLFAGIEHAQDNIQDTFPRLKEYPKAELLSFEKELLGFYLTQHPMANALKAVQKSATKTISELDPHVHKDTVVWLGGILSQWRTVLTKKSQAEMGFGTLDDGTGRIEIVIFPKAFAAHKELIKQDNVLLIKGKIEVREEKPTFLVDAIKAPDIDEDLALQDDNAQEIEIPRTTTREQLGELGKFLKAHPGETSIVLLIPNGETPKKMKLPYGVNWTEKIQAGVKTILRGE